MVANGDVLTMREGIVGGMRAHGQAARRLRVSGEGYRVGERGTEAMSGADLLRSRLGLKSQPAANGAEAGGDVAVRPPFLAVVNDRTVEILEHRRGSSI